MKTSSTRSRRKLTKWEWALLIVPPLIIFALLFGARVWYQLTGTLYTKQQEIGGINFSRDGKQLVAVAATDERLGDGVTRRSQDVMNWDVATGKLLLKAEVRGKEVVWFPTVYKNGTIVAAVIGNNHFWEVRQWSAAGEKHIDQKNAYLKELRRLKDDRRFVVSGDNTTIYDSQTLAPLRKMPLGKVDPYVEISTDEQTLFCVRNTPKGSHGEVWDLEKARRLRVFSFETWMNALSPDGGLLATVPRKIAKKGENEDAAGFNDVDIDLRDLKTGRKIRTYRHIKSTYGDQFKFSPDGKKLLCAGPIFVLKTPRSTEIKQVERSVAQIIDIETDKIVTVNIAGYLRRSAFSPNGRLLALSVMQTSTAPTSFQIRNTEDGRILFSRASNSREISFRFSPDNRLVAYSNGNSIKVVDISNLS